LANVSESDFGGIKPDNKATFSADAYAKRPGDDRAERR
jgi:hypothetical protein